MATLRGDLERLLNSHSAENNSDTPDFILAEFLLRSLEVWDCCVNERDKWYGKVRWKTDASMSATPSENNLLNP